MTQLTKTDLATQISTLLADNTAGDISASDVRSVFTDSKDSLVGGPASATDNAIVRFDSTTGQLVQNSVVTVADTTGVMAGIGALTLADDGALRTTTTTTDKITIDAYDVNGAAYVPFITLTAADTPLCVISSPAGGTCTIESTAIGGVTPAAGAFTTLAASGDVAVATNKFTVASATGNTAVAGTLGITGATTAANVTSSGYIRESVGNALTATGSARADALQLAKQVNNVTTAAASTGVILPVGAVGDIIILNNAGANPIQVYATASETIDTVAGATGVPLTNAKRCMYIFVAADTWISAQLGVVSA